MRHLGRIVFLLSLGHWASPVTAAQRIALESGYIDAGFTAAGANFTVAVRVFNV